MRGWWSSGSARKPRQMSSASVVAGIFPSHRENAMPSDPTTKPAKPLATRDKPHPGAAPQTESSALDADKDEPVPHERPPVRSDDN